MDLLLGFNFINHFQINCSKKLPHFTRNNAFIDLVKWNSFSNHFQIDRSKKLPHLTEDSYYIVFL